MSTLIEKIRKEFTPSTSPCGMTEKGCVHFHSRVLSLLDAHERLEAAIAGTGDTAILTVNILRKWPAEERIAFARHMLGAEWKAPEHERLEGLLRAWWTARGDDESEASKELWEEAARLARTPA